MLIERFDEALLLLRHMLGWSLIDLTYVRVNGTKKGNKRWDGKPFVDEPHYDDLPEKVCEGYPGSVY